MQNENSNNANEILSSIQSAQTEAAALELFRSAERQFKALARKSLSSPAPGYSDLKALWPQIESAWIKRTREIRLSSHGK